MANCVTCGRPDTPLRDTPAGRAHICERDAADTWPELATSSQPVYYNLDYWHEQALAEDR